MKFFKFIKSFISIINKLEAITTILEELSKLTVENLKKHEKILPIQEKTMKKLKEHQKK